MGTYDALINPTGPSATYSELLTETPDALTNALVYRIQTKGSDAVFSGDVTFKALMESRALDFVRGLVVEPGEVNKIPFVFRFEGSAFGSVNPGSVFSLAGLTYRVDAIHQTIIQNVCVLLTVTTFKY